MAYQPILSGCVQRVLLPLMLPWVGEALTRTPCLPAASAVYCFG